MEQREDTPMRVLRTYKYEGPLPLGSVLANNCGAAGLFVAPKGMGVEPADVLLKAIEKDGRYHLEVFLGQDLFLETEGPISPEGRKTIGKEVLYALRTAQGIATYGVWGSLVGVRPTKLYARAFDEIFLDKLLDLKEPASLEQGTEFYNTIHKAVEKRFKNRHNVAPSIIKNLREIFDFQRPYLEKAVANDRCISLYSGIPFCQSHCIYCSFPYGLVQEYAELDRFVETYGRDIDNIGEILERYNLKLESLYMGGGTPTSLNNADFDFIVSKLGNLLHKYGQTSASTNSFTRTRASEFTVEAGRPDSVTPEKIQSMYAAGVNRISINPQSMQDHILQRIGRAHTAEAVKELYEYVRKHTSFDINMDFIAGLPEQTFKDMEVNMDFVCRTLPENVTIHTLALKRGSPLYEQKGSVTLPTLSEVEEMVHYSRQRLLEAGYKPYYLYRQQYMTGQFENIGYTLPDKECVYNIQMMEERQTVLSVGPGSSSKWIRIKGQGPEFDMVKQHMPKNVDTYIETFDNLMNKRNMLSKKFWESEG